MKRNYEIVKDILITIGILCVCFFVCFAIHTVFERNALIPSVLVLGVFLISVITHIPLSGFSNPGPGTSRS